MSKDSGCQLVLEVRHSNEIKSIIKLVHILSPVLEVRHSNEIKSN